MKLEETLRRPKTWSLRSEKQLLLTTRASDLNICKLRYFWRLPGSSSMERQELGIRVTCTKTNPGAPRGDSKFLQNIHPAHSQLHRSWTNRFRSIPFEWHSIKEISTASFSSFLLLKNFSLIFFPSRKFCTVSTPDLFTYTADPKVLLIVKSPNIQTFVTKYYWFQ